MCGIAGYIDLKRDRRAERPVIESMSQALIHRGPDSSGFYVNKSIALAFRRLKIIDLFTGDQPLYSEDKSIVLVCNGEIYNYRELRQELRNKNIAFKTKTDVEVLIYLYQEQGIDFINRVNGQFAFVIYDKKKDELYLARDQFGICPLYYAVADDYLVFASEIKGILKHPSVNRRVDLTGLDQLFTFPGLISPWTLFEGISSLPGGHYVRVAGGNITSRKYWDLSYPVEYPASRPDTEYIDRLDELMTRSVRYRLQSDVPVGSYLSGGLDSSLILSYIGDLQPPQKLTSFSVSFPDRAQDESYYQTLLARQAKSSHTSLRFDLSQSYDLMRKMVYHSECAVKESYNICSMALSRLVKDSGVSVVLSGEGADELFSGYVGYRFDDQGVNFNNDNILAQALEEECRERLWGDSEFFYEKTYTEHNALRSSLYSRSLAPLFEEFNCLNFDIVDKRYLAGRSKTDKRAYLDFKLRLSDHLLTDHGDRMGMANAVEIRYPFLDIDLVEFAATIPRHMKIRNGEEKYILRRIGQNKLPVEICRRQKFGFHAPGSPYLLKLNIEWINDMLSYNQIKRQGYFDPDGIGYLRELYSRPGFSLDIPYEDDLLMVVLTFGIFLEEFDMPVFG